MGILIGADIVPTPSNYDFFLSADLDSLIGKELINVFQEADYRILNLEVPLTDSNTPIDKGGHNMKAPTGIVNSLKAMDIDLVTLCNNHIMDYGRDGLKDTCDALEQVGISYFGVGDDVKKAWLPFFFEYNNCKVGVYTCAEHEFSIAKEKSPGANPYDPLNTFDHISGISRECDYLIVLYHGGKEHYPYPSPNLQKRCRKMVEKGANVVICQHSHCVGCKEEYLNGTIVYGQGNFLFDLNNNECWNSGLIIVIDNTFKIKYIPIEKRASGIRIASEKDILEKFFERSDRILTDDFVEKNYKEFAMKSSGYYLLGISKNRVLMFFFRALNKLSKQRLMVNCSLRKKYSGKYYMRLRNFIECEAHNELIISALTNDNDR